MSTLIYDGVGFNTDLVKQMSRQEFVNHQMHENHYTKLSVADKKKKLHKIYTLITGFGPDKKKRRDL